MALILTRCPVRGEDVSIGQQTTRYGPAPSAGTVLELHSAPIQGAARWYPAFVQTT